MRKLIAAIAGGVIVFLWGALSHTVLSLGHEGLTPLPNEDAVLAALSTSVPNAGLYFFPGMNMSREPTEAETAAWNSKYQSGPTGLLLYHPKGGALPPSGQQLLNEFLSNVLGAWIAALVVSLIAAAYWRRVGAIASLGLFAWMSISVSHWNWYGFPSSFILAEGIDQFVSWLLAGLAIAAIVRRR